MLLLHSTFKNSAFILFSLIVFASCSDKTKNQAEVIKVLNESIENSNRVINASTKDILHSLEEKIKIEGSAERARVWYPKAKKVEQLSDDLLTYIERIKTDPKPGFGSELFNTLVTYKNDILSIDPKITHEFKNSLRLFTRAIDSATTNQGTMFQNYFSDKSTTIAMLNKVQNNIRILEWKLTTYCHDNVGYVDGPGYFTVTIPIISFSSTVVQPGETIEIVAGLGSVNVNQKPEILIYGKPVPLNYDGAAHYQLKASSKPGQYIVPVKINYADQDGRAQRYKKEIEYTVANIQKE